MWWHRIRPRQSADAASNPCRLERNSHSDAAADHALGPRIIPAPTVVLVDSATRMKEPVVRLRRYSSKKIGAVVRSDTRPTSFRSSETESSESAPAPADVAEVTEEPEKP